MAKRPETSARSSDPRITGRDHVPPNAENARSRVGNRRKINGFEAEN